MTSNSKTPCWVWTVNPHADLYHLKSRLAYALPAFALAIIGIPVYVYIPKFYTDVVGIDIAVAGILLFGVRLFDAITDPLMGTLSDRTRSRFGRRRPYILIGSMLLAIALIFLFNPPSTVDLEHRLVCLLDLCAVSVLDPGHGSL
jgi:Na+/melibiose symporter-like transporter